MAGSRVYPRLVEPLLLDSLADTPAVLVHGPRQCGKSTLVRLVGERHGYASFTFDDERVQSAARADPAGFVADLPRRAILDEVQRVPSIFLPLKIAIDRNREPGRFLMTGSAQVLLVPKLADSLAGRMGILRLHPLAQCELEEAKPRFLDALFAGKFRFGTSPRLGPELATRVVAGGYPEALARRAAGRRTAWYRDLVESHVQRDVQDFARIRALDTLPRLLEIAASHTAQLINFETLAAPFELSRPTIQDYVTLLERVFLIDRLPPWHINRWKRLVKTSKLHIGDTGIACALLGLGADDLYRDKRMLGPLLETFVLQELRRQASGGGTPVAFYHSRDRDGVEVDIVLERGSLTVAGIEVKASATVTPSDFRGLRKLKEAAGKAFVCGVVLYDGETTASFGGGMFVVPLRALWETT